MWCCKEYPDNHEEFIDDTDEKANEYTGMNDLEIKEWNMTLRENTICMDEYNVKVKRQKIEAIEQIEAERRLAREKEIDEKEKELILQQRLLEAARMELEQTRTREREMEEREEELALQRQALDDRERNLQEKNAVLEIVVRLNEKEQKIALHLRNLASVKPEEIDADMLSARERELEEREQELFLRQRELEEREFDMDDKNAVLEIAIRGNEFSHEPRLRGFGRAGSEENNPNQNNKNNTDDQMNSAGDDSTGSPAESSSDNSA